MVVLKRLLTVTFCLFNTAFFISGYSNTDSLLTLLEEASNDSSRIELLISISNAFSRSDLEKAENYANEAVQIAKKSKKDKKRQALSISQLGNIYFFKNEYEEAKKMYQQALEIGRQENDSSVIVTIIPNIANIETMYGNYDSAIKLFLQVIEISKKMDKPEPLANSLNTLGVIYFKQGDYLASIDFFLKSLKIKEKSGDKIAVAKTLNNIGSIYSQVRKHDEAIQYFSASLQIRKEFNDLEGIASILNNIGANHSYAGSIDSALYYFQEALKVNERIGNESNIAEVYNNMGTAYLQLKDYEKAAHYTGLALKIRTAMGIKDGQLKSLTQLNEIYHFMGDYARANKNAFETLELAKELNSLELIKKSLQLIHLSYAAMGDHKNAYDYFHEFTAIRDSIMNESKFNSIAELEKKYQAEKKETEISLLKQVKKANEAEIKTSRYVRYAMGGGIFFLLMIAGLIYNRYRIKNKLNGRLNVLNLELEQKNAEISIQKENMELKALLAQMNPHFIFNSLNSIQQFITDNNKEEANKYLSLFGNAMRSTLENSEKTAIPLVEELDNLEKYVALESLRADNPLDFQITIDPAIDSHNTSIPPMLIQPHIENAIWHGVMPLKEKGRIALKLELRDEKIFCVIEDNGIGREASAKIKRGLTNRKSFGRNITAQRLEVLWRKKNASHSMNYMDMKDEIGNSTGTRVEFYLPLIF